jgi:hypothetical protein
MLDYYIELVILGKGLALIGLPALSLKLQKFATFVICVVISLILGSIWLYGYVYDQVDCATGNQTVCNEYVQWRPDFVNAQGQAWELKRGQHIDGEDGFNWAHLPKWNLVKKIWIDGEFVTVTRLCLGMDYPKYEHTREDEMCYAATITSGKHTGTIIPRRPNEHVDPRINQYWADSPGSVND